VIELSQQLSLAGEVIERLRVRRSGKEQLLEDQPGAIGSLREIDAAVAAFVQHFQDPEPARRGSRSALIAARRIERASAGHARRRAWLLRGLRQLGAL
jgi:hypothetical protein